MTIVLSSWPMAASLSMTARMPSSIARGLLARSLSHFVDVHGAERRLAAAPTAACR